MADMKSAKNIQEVQGAVEAPYAPDLKVQTFDRDTSPVGKNISIDQVREALAMQTPRENTLLFGHDSVVRENAPLFTPSISVAEKLAVFGPGVVYLGELPKM